MDVTIQYYTDDGELRTITVPNRAKDRQNILDGEGAPEGTVSGQKGAIYQDLTNGAVYVKQFDATDINGWSQLISESDLEEVLAQGSSNPEGQVTLPKGALYIDRQTASLYIKTTATGNTGWKLISADTSLLALKNLSNLSEEGEAHFANPSLSNLSSTGQAVLDSKELLENKTNVLNSSSTINQYPTAKVVYDTIVETTTPLADRDLSNLNVEGERHFIGMDQVRDCILEAPNGLPSRSGNTITLLANTILLCTSGVTSTKARNQVRVKISNAVSVTESYTSSTGIIDATVWYNHTDGNLTYSADSKYFRQVAQPTVSGNAVWFNPNTNLYKITNNSGSTWTTKSMCEIAKFTTNTSGAIASFWAYHPIVVATQDEIDNLDRRITEKSSFYEYTSGGEFKERFVTYCNTLNTNISTVSNNTNHASDLWLYSTPAYPYLPMTTQTSGTSHTFTTGGVVICTEATNVTVGQGAASLVFTNFVGMLPVGTGAVVSTTKSSYFANY